MRVDRACCHLCKLNHLSVESFLISVYGAKAQMKGLLSIGRIAFRTTRTIGCSFEARQQCIRTPRSIGVSEVAQLSLHGTQSVRHVQQNRSKSCSNSSFAELSW